MKNDNMTGNSVSEVKKGCSINCFGTFSSILQALFICMKLGMGGSNQIMEWSWWWVFCPSWINLLFVLCIWILWAVIAAVLKALE